MVKLREPNALKKILGQPTKKQVEAFAAAADGNKSKALNPYAQRNFKSIRLTLNEFEYRELENLARKTGRTKLSAIRWAIVEAIRNNL